MDARLPSGVKSEMGKIMMGDGWVNDRMNEQMKVMFMSPTNEIDVDRKNLKQLFQYGHGFLLLTRINLIPVCMINHIPNKVWDEITYLSPNFNGFTVKVKVLISNFIPHFIMDMIICSCWN